MLVSATQCIKAGMCDLKTLCFYQSGTGSSRLLSPTSSWLAAYWVFKASMPSEMVPSQNSTCKIKTEQATF